MTLGHATQLLGLFFVWLGVGLIVARGLFPPKE